MSRADRWARWPVFATALACVSAGIGLLTATGSTGREAAAAFLLAVGGVMLGVAITLNIQHRNGRNGNGRNGRDG